MLFMKVIFVVNVMVSFFINKAICFSLVSDVF